MDEQTKYINHLLEINKSLRDQIEECFKILKMKIKIETFQNHEDRNLRKLVEIIDKLETLNKGLNYTLSKNSECLNKITKKFEKKEKEMEIMLNETKLENERFKEKNNELEMQRNEFLKEKSELEDKIEKQRLNQNNLMNLVKELEKKKINSLQNNNKNEKNDELLKDLKEENFFLKTKIKELETKFQIKLDKKDEIIKQLDKTLLEYENQLKSYLL